MLIRGHRSAGTASRTRSLRLPAVAGLMSAVLVLGLRAPATAADEPPVPADAQPLHRRIDEALDRGVGTSLPGRCGDEVFLRRASLDFLGFTPTADEIRSFAADPAPDKRAQRLDAMLADPQHLRHLATVLDVMLMERRAEKHVKTTEWREWLRGQAAARTPWDQLARAVLTAEGAEGAPRGAARWLLDREAEPNALARDTARLFLGMDLACAQCHDHPRIADYWQKDYHGLLAFFSRTFLFQPDPMKLALVGERAEGEAAFASVFTSVAGHARPQLPRGKPVDEPAAAPGDLWSVAPDEKNKSLRPVPRHSRKALLAAPLTASRDFALNAANRFWAVLLGRGVIEPVDLRHSANPPAADALLDVLADGMVALNYDVSAYWREVALSRAYQADYDPPAALAASPTVEPATLQAAAEEATAAEQAARRVENTGRETWEPLQLAAQKLEGKAAEAAKAVAAARPPAEAAAAAHARSAAALAAKTELLPILEAAATQCAQAARVVADAPELAQAAALLQTRLTTTQAERDTLAKEAAAKEADRATLTTTLTAAAEAAAAVAPRAAAARTAADTAWQEVAAAAGNARATRETARRATRDAARAAALAAHQLATRQEQEARERLATTEQTAQAVAAAAASVQAVCAKFPEDPELATILAAIRTRHAATTATLEDSRDAAAAATTAATGATDALVPALADSFALTRLTPLSPEQLCWSILRTTGTLDQLRAQAAREWDDKNPAPADPAAATPARATTRAAAIEALTEEKVRPHEDQFIRLFGNGPGSPQTDFFATSDQALYFENAGTVRSWTQPGDGNLAERLAAITDPAALAHAMYLAVLNRSPADEEVAEIVSNFSSRPPDQKPAALSDTLWALLTSTEFRFKH